MLPAGMRWIVAAVAAAAVIAAGVALRVLPLYLAGCVLLAAIAAAAAWRAWPRGDLRRMFSSGRRSLIAAGAAFAVLVVTVAIPWLAAIASGEQGAVTLVADPRIDSQVVGPYLALPDDSGGLVLRTAEGNVVGAHPSQRLSWTADDHIVSTEREDLALRNLSGELLFAFSGRLEALPVARVNGVTVVSDCYGGVCDLVGLDGQGAELWRQPGDPRVVFREQHGYESGETEARSDIVPEVVVAEGVAGSPGFSILDASTGARLAGDPDAEWAATVGDIAVLSSFDESAGEGRVRAFRGGEELWTVEGAGDDAPLLGPVGARLYGFFGRSQVSIDAVDGTVRDLTAEAPEGLRDDKIWASDDTIVYLLSDAVVAIDPVAGTELWRRPNPRDEAWSIDVADGSVIVGTEPGGLNPFVARRDRGYGLMRTAIDARSGDKTGAYRSYNQIWDALPFGNGGMLIQEGRRAVVVFP